ncbi:MAG: adenine-specific methyltransferase EcoRI family protein [Terracidiphilus sp.]|jgi:hypothetical protein
MIKKVSNQKLGNARHAKQDEFYTQLGDIENELRHYKAQLLGKTILCNCDDPFESNFFRYFALNFNTLRLKKLIATSYVKSPIVGGQLPLLDMEGLKPEGEEPYAIEINEVPDHKRRGATDLADVEYLLKHDANSSRALNADGIFDAGDFRSRDCVEFLKEADIVVTNPPFSLFREFVAQIVAHNKKFLIIGNKNALHYQDIFKLIKEDKLWVGARAFSGGMWFVADYVGKYEKVIDGVKLINVPAIWLTNMDNPKRHEKLPLYKRYTPDGYPTYDNYDAIEVSKTNEIPCDYDGLMGVPDAFLDKYNPDQFELIGIPFGDLGKAIGVTKNYRGRTDIAITKDGTSRCPYSRIIIRRKS